MKRTEDILKRIEEKYKNGDITKEEYTSLREKYHSLQKALGEPTTPIDSTVSQEPKFQQIRAVGIYHNPDFQGKGPIKVAGSVRITQDMIKVRGSASLPGGIKTKDCKVSGSCKVRGNLECHEFKASGSSKIQGHLTSHGNVKASGGFRIGGDLFAEGDVNLDAGFKIRGKIQAKGNVELKLSNYESEVNDGIEAESIKVKSGWLSRGSLVTSNIFVTGLLDIENTKATNLKGAQVIVRKDCEIKGTIEYTEDVEIHPEAKITSQPQKVKATK